MDNFTLFHVALSLVGIATGFVVIAGLIVGKRLDRLTGVFLVTTLMTSVTGFMFPYHGVTPGIVIGVISVIVLAVAIAARYQRHLVGGWRKTYAITAVIAQYFNFFVLIVQLFQKVPALHAMAPTLSGAPFVVAQSLALVLFIVLGIASTVRFKELVPAV
ncbi:MAG TPA: hypothetical protein VHZ24_06930 [Pirellulales bacterium]|jgi:hypothetical protein|nr:hypothetical protein [Pirellulales bacterium]